MNEWSLAVRNLLRNRRRSLSTAFALAIGLTATLLFSGFRASLAQTMLTAYARAGGHVQVQHRDYFLFGSGNPNAYAIAGYEKLLDAIRNDAVLKPLVAVATPMLRFGGLAGNFDAGISRTVIGTGYVAEDFHRMRKWNEFAVTIGFKDFALLGTPPDAAVIGIGVARVLQFCKLLAPEDCPAPQAPDPIAPKGKATALPSDIADLAQLEHAGSGNKKPAAGVRMELLVSGTRGAPNVAALNVVAAEGQGFKELDEVSAILHLSQAQQLVFGRGQPKVTAIMVLANKTADETLIKDRVHELVDQHGGAQPLVVRGFEEMNPYYVQSIQLFNVIFDFIFALIGCIVLFTVSNTMNTAVIERTVEIGTLRAIGLRQNGIRRLFIYEGVILGAVGVTTGLAAAVILGEAVNHSGVTWLPPGSTERVLLQLRVLGDRWTLVSTTLGLVVIATASAWWPAWRAAKLKIVEALRHA